jgi:NAD(P)-dependent dehydrogenase (short-subunit alcohol dehydrogenase family)
VQEEALSGKAVVVVGASSGLGLAGDRESLWADRYLGRQRGVPDRTPHPRRDDRELWDRVMEVNLKSVFLVSQAVLPVMKRQGKGRIINVSSIAARNGGGPGSVAYAAAKGGVSTLTRAVAKELISENILVNGIAPGIITTPFHDQFTPPELR